MRLDKIILILLISISLGACSTAHKFPDASGGERVDVNNTKGFKFNRSHLGATLGGATGAMTCVELIGTDPYIAAGCAVVGALAGAELLYASEPSPPLSVTDIACLASELPYAAEPASVNVPAASS